MFELWSKQYNNEQEIIDAGIEVIYHYCYYVKGRWIGIEHLMVEDEFYGYLYARDIIRCRYEPELETIYLMRHGGKWVDWYVDDLVEA